MQTEEVPVGHRKETQVTEGGDPALWSDWEGKGVMEGRDHILLRETVRVKKDGSHTLWKDRQRPVITTMSHLMERTSFPTLLTLYNVIGKNQHFHKYT